jgi:hypothetical protein
LSACGTKRKLRDRLSRVDKGYVMPEPLTFGEYAQRWFQDGLRSAAESEGRLRSSVSVERRLVEAFGRMQLAEMRPRHIADFVSEHLLGASTVGRDLSVLSAIFKTALREDS